MADKDSLSWCTLSDQRKIQTLLGKTIRDVEFPWKEGGLAVWTCFLIAEKTSEVTAPKQISCGGFCIKIIEGLACNGSKINVYGLFFGLKKAKLGISI